VTEEPFNETDVEFSAIDWSADERNAYEPPQAATEVYRFLYRAVGFNYLAQLASVVCAFGVVLLVFIFAAGKWSFIDTPYGHSVVLFHGIQVLVIILLLKYWGWPRLKRASSTEEMALRLEQTDPSLHDCLSSALQFRSPDPLLAECLRPSHNLLDGFFQETEESIKSQSRWRSIIPKSFWVSLGLLSLAIGLWSLMDRFVPFTGGDAWKFYQKNFLANPYRPLHSLNVDPGNDDKLTGESVKVRASLLGPGFHDAAITYEMEGFPSQTTQMKVVDADLNSFEFPFENLQSDLRYRVNVGPIASRDYILNVFIPAELSSIQLTYHFPEFMDRNIEVMPAGQGAAQAPMGTTVELSTRWTREMAEVNVSVNGDDPIPMFESSSYWKGKFVLESAGSYVLSGSSADGVPLRGDLEFPIEALVDMPPVVKWVWPKKDLDFSTKKPKKKIPLRYRISDDHGITSVTLHTGAPGSATREHPIAEFDGKERDVEGFFEFNPRPWMDYPVCFLYIEAFDNHPTRPGLSRNESRRLYFAEPGTFDEFEELQEEIKKGADPFVIVATRVFRLLKQETAQVEKFSETRKLSGKEKIEWLEIQDRLARVTAETALLAYEVSISMKQGPGNDEQSDPKDDTEAAGAAQVENLLVKMEAAAIRLAGEGIQVDILNSPEIPEGNSALHRLLRQKRAGEEDRGRRAGEEGERALVELRNAYKELTGLDPPVPAEEIEEEMEKQLEEAADEGEKGEDAEEDKEDSQLPTIWEEAMGKNVDPIEIEESAGGGGEDAEITDNLMELVIAALEYEKSSYTIDPNTVRLRDQTAKLINSALANNYSNVDLSDYQKKPVPAEYQDAAVEYARILAGEE